MSFNEKLSYTESVVTTPTTDFAIGFKDYGGDSDTIEVTVDDVLATDAGYTVFRKNAMTIALEPAVTSGIVRLQRETNIDSSFYSFTAGAKFVAANVDANFEQILHSQQETRDGFNKLYSDVIPLVDGLTVALEQADKASKAAQEAAEAAEEAAQVSRSASQVYDSSGLTQQDLNDQFKTLYVPSITPQAPTGGNDTALVQAALNSDQRVINLSGRTYKVNALTVPSGKVVTNGTLQLLSATTLLTVTQDTQLVDLTLRGTGNTSELLGEILVLVNGTVSQAATDNIITRCRLLDSCGYAVRANYPTRNIYVNNVVRNIRYGGFLHVGALDCSTVNNHIQGITGLASNGNAYGITYTSDSLVTVVNGGRISRQCVAVGNTIRDIPTWNALDTHGGQGLVYANNSIINCGFPIGIVSLNKPDGVVQPKYVTVANNTIDNSQLVSNRLNVGISAVGANVVDGNYAEGIAIVGNVLIGCGVPSNNIAGAIKIGSCLGCTVVGNTLKGSYNIGINVYIDSVGFTVSGNTIIDTFDPDPATPAVYGIIVRSNRNLGVITGNTTWLSGLPITGKEMSIGIAVSSGSTGNDVRIALNHSNAALPISGLAGLVGGSDMTVLGLTDNTGGLANDVLQDIGATYNKALLSNNFADLTRKINQIIAACRRAGIIV